MRHKLLELIQQRELAEDRRLTIAEISRESNVPRPTIHYWLKNPYLAKIDSATIINLCHYFDCEIGDLVKLEDVIEA